MPDQPLNYLFLDDSKEQRHYLIEQAAQKVIASNPFLATKPSKESYFNDPEFRREYREGLRAYHRELKSLAQVYAKALTDLQSQIGTGCIHVGHRVKRVEEIWGKAVRKRFGLDHQEPRPSYTLGHVTDGVAAYMIFSDLLQLYRGLEKLRSVSELTVVSIDNKRTLLFI